MQIDWWTLALQTVNFLVLVWLLGRFLYQPVREVIEQRKQLAERAFAEVDKQKSEAEAARQSFEQAREQLLQERQDMLKKVHEELETERHEAFDVAEHEAEKLLEVARGALAREREVALAVVREQIAELAVELASDLLTRVGSSASTGIILEQFERQLRDMPADERERLRKDLSADSARLTVVTAVSLTSGEQEQWTDRLCASLGQKDKTDFAIDPEILGGAEIRFPHAVLKFTWADQLQKARELLQKDDASS
jgi:F-type H+-transporting ATPase subunit b